MNDHLAMLAALCAPGGSAIPIGLLLAGLAGSVMHCAPMCGPFVLGQVADRMARIPATHLCESARLGAGLLAPYHLGRLLTYAGLGALAAGLAGAGAPRGGMGRAAGVLLGIGALLFLLQAAARLAPALGRLGLTRAPAGWMRLLRAATRRTDRTSWSGSLLLGLALGFLPCGMLYAALAVAAASGNAAQGALAMVAFALGTMPSLMVIGLAGRAAGQLWQRGIARLAPLLMLANAALLAGMAWSMLIG